MAALGHSARFGTGIALFIAGLVFFGFAVYEFGIGRKLERDAVQTDATIVDKRETKGSKGRKKRHVDLRFVDAGGREHKMSHSGSKLWRKSIGEQVAIMYLRDDPGTTRLVGENKLGGYIVAGVFFTIVGLVLGLPPVLRARRAST
jgi:hypothetical protein